MRSTVPGDWEERELAAACSQKDPKAEEELYTRYAARVYSLCRRYSDDPEGAKDLLQETFIKLLDSISSFRYRGRGSLYAWIRRIAVNQSIDQIRKRARLRTLSLDAGAPEENPDEGGEEVERVPEEALLEMIRRLPDVQRAVFNLYCIEGYSHKEIGKLLEISEKGSAGILAKARKQLKGEVEQYLKETEL